MSQWDVIKYCALLEKLDDFILGIILRLYWLKHFDIEKVIYVLGLLFRDWKQIDVCPLIVIVIVIWCRLLPLFFQKVAP